MRIKQGFVTNSSSSSYLVVIPKKFDVDDHHKKILEYIDDNSWDEEDSGDTYQDVKLAVTELKNRGALSQEEFYNAYYPLKALLDDLGLVIFQMDGTGGDCQGMLYNLSHHKDVIKKIKELDV